MLNRRMRRQCRRLQEYLYEEDDDGGDGGMGNIGETLSISLNILLQSNSHSFVFGGVLGSV